MRRTERTARKSHACTFCDGVIDAGARYIDGFWIWEGEPSPWKAHLDCQGIADRCEIGDDGVPPFSEWDAGCCSAVDWAAILKIQERNRASVA